MTETLGGCVDSSQPSQEETAAAARAWSRLSAALSQTTPPCDGDALFTAGRLTEAQRESCEATCSACSVITQCAAYADAARMKFGFWGGRSYTS